jgi:predicted AAA+ superfamily ATPase
MAMLFEQFIGMELLRHLRLYAPHFQLKYWRDHNGPEVDYVIDMNNTYLPIEVKWTTNPSVKDAAHLIKFMQEYPCTEIVYLICRVTHPRQIAPGIVALPWQALREWQLPTA